MQTATDPLRHASTAIDLRQLHLTAQEMDAVRRGLTIALTKVHREGREAPQQGR